MIRHRLYLVGLAVWTMLDLLKPRGYLGIEHDDTTSAEVKAILAATGRCDEIVARRDLAGRERFVTARKL